ncbi:hypothetical protein [Priestia aryabhattai]|uniref:hypothetical protein n=1 Tax=Priestia aryabhattai TaxID=412384 RepID=UPI001C8F14AA|nr:hypothetical protein [Priestia aryabhattai]MBY0214494.1 hypothetical protein [Priestia aryabhattai]
MRKNKKILLAVAVSILILFMGGKYLFAMAQKIGCSDDVIQRIEMKSGYVVKVHQTNCGATTDFGYKLTLTHHSKDEKEILSYGMLEADSHIEVDVHNNQINVTYSPATIVYSKGSKYKGVLIHFERQGGNVSVPQSFENQRKSFDLEIADLFANSLIVYRNEEIPAGQVHFAVSEKGNTSKKWNSNWLVIGTIEYTLPIFIHSDEENSPVYVGQKEKNSSTWKEVKIASTYQDFQKALKLIDDPSGNRSFPEDVQTNPLPEKEIKHNLKVINKGNIDLSFWNDWMIGKSLPDKYIE